MRVGYVLGLSLQTELIILSFFGIMCTIFDASLLEFHTNMYKIWDIRMDPNKFSEKVEMYMKYTLICIVLVRTFTVHIYLGCYIVMLYPLLFEDRPGLIIPWMTVNIVKCLITAFISLLAGTYTCLMYRFMQPTCWEFLLSDFFNHIPSLYMFCLVLTFYRELKKLIKVSKYIDPIELKARRRRARLISDSKMALDYKEVFSRSFDGLIRIAETDEPLANRTTGMKASKTQSTVSDAASYCTTTSYLDDHTTTKGRIIRVKDAACSGQNVSQNFPLGQGVILELPKRDNVVNTDDIDLLEELEHVSNLDVSNIDLGVMAVVSSHRTEPTVAAVSDILDDPKVAAVLNLIASAEDPWEAEAAQLEALDVDVLDHNVELMELLEAAQAGSSKNSKSERTSLHTKTQEAGQQVSSPSFEIAMANLETSHYQQQAPKPFMPIDIHEVPQKDVPYQSSNKKKSTLTEPSIVKEENSKVLPHMEGPSKIHDLGTGTPAISQIYKNRASYVKAYKDDGYAQAFFENLRKRSN